MSLEISSGAPFSSSFSSSLVMSKEPIAQSYSYPVERAAQRDPIPSYCKGWGVAMACESGHVFGRSIDCRHDWCSCRNRAHELRFSRWIKKAKKIGVMAYLEISFHPDDRPRSRGAWRMIRRGVIRGLKARRFDRGMASWHWFGDEEPHAWHAHLNFLYEARGNGWLKKGELKSIKKMVRTVTGLKEVYVNYRFSAKKSKKIKWVRYVTRPTFLKKSWDEGMAYELEGSREWNDEKEGFDRRPQFKNCVTWGKWDDEDYLPQEMDFHKLRELIASGTCEPDDRLPLPVEWARLSYVKKAEKGVCPVCDEKLKFVGVLSIEDMIEMGFERIWDNLWQMRAPPEKVLEYEYFKKVDRIHRDRGP